MSYIRIWVHCVWTTKNRIPYLTERIRDEITIHIRQNAKLKGIYIDQLNGFEEHLHTIISLGGSQSISEVMQKIKGESSFWINKNQLTRMRFEWQDDYYAVSVGMSHLENLREYIRNQREHHSKVTCEDELEQMISEYKMERMQD